MVTTTLLKFIRARMPERLNPLGTRTIDRVEHMLTGMDESAQSQRMALSVFSIRVLSAVIAFASQVLLARWMGSFEYGIFVAVWTGIIILDTIICFGAPSASIRFVGKYREEKNHGLLWGVIIGSLTLGLISSMAFTGLALALFYFSPNLLGPEYSNPAFIALLSVPILVLVGIAESIGRAFNWTSISFLPPYVLRPLMILLLIFIGLRFGYQATALTAAVAALAASHLVALTQMAFIAMKLLKTIPRKKPEFKLKYWLMVTMPVFLVESFYVLLTSVDVIFVSWLATPEETAVYFASTKILALVHFAYFAVRAAAAHRYSAYHASGDEAALASYVKQSISWTFWPSLLLGVFMVITGKYFLWLFGDEFVFGSGVLGILVLGIVIRSSVGPAESLLVMTENQNACAGIYVCALFVNVVLNISLIPIYGIYGAAIATTAALVFESLALYATIRRKLGFHAFILGKATDQTPSGGLT